MRPLIYILDDDQIFAELVKANLGRAGEFKIQLFDNPLDCLDAVSEAPPDVLLTDLYMDEMDGVEVSRRARELLPHLPIFLLTARGDITTAIEAMKAGASEYLLKPVNVSELTMLIRKVMGQRPLLEEATSLRQSRRERFSVNALLGEHELIRETRTFLQGVASVRHVNVLLLGESGVGKNLAARAIHYADPAMEGQFIELNCAALPAPLMEAELFGYKKGAVADAQTHKPGLVEVADGGTLFLDEISEMPPEIQAKLLKFMESGRFRRIGGAREREVTVRIIAATNRPVDSLLGQGGFREDLFYRLSAAHHTLPPLRDMLSDVPVLAEAFMRQTARDLGRSFEGISDDAA